MHGVGKEEVRHPHMPDAVEVVRLDLVEREEQLGEIVAGGAQRREFARERHISLGGESSKQGLVTEIMSQYGSQWRLREGEELE